MALVPTSLLVRGLFHGLALSFKLRPSLKRYLVTAHGPLNFSVVFATEDGKLRIGLEVRDGGIKVLPRGPERADVTLVFADEQVIREMLRLPPHEVLHLLLKNRMRTEGNLTWLNAFNLLLSLALARGTPAAPRAKGPARDRSPLRRGRKERLHGPAADPGVKFLADPYLSALRLEDFPRLERALETHFNVRPALCPERALLVTQWHQQHGFEQDRSGQPWHPALRQGSMLKHLLESRRPIIREGDLLAGTTTAQEIGVVLYPDAHGTLIWGELLTLPDRELNPYDLAPQTLRVLHDQVFPYWAHRNFREWVRERHHAPLCQRLDERFAVYFLWKTAAISHTIPDFPALLRKGARAMIDGLRAEAARADRSEDERRTLEGMRLGLEGLCGYAKNLSAVAKREAAACAEPKRRAELLHLEELCARVPEQPARTLDEAVQALWLGWVALHMESTNAGLSLGRLDQWLQPYFEADLRGLEPAQRDAYLRHAVELIGCFYLKCTDHLPLIPDLGNYLFGGSSSDQAITLGGVTPAGEDGVCDMTYVFLKVTELLGIRDPNVNARFDPKKNSDSYLRRLCEVNLITSATPSMHNDQAVLSSLARLGYPPEHARDWAATGCVEPTVCGKHMGHTNSMMLNLVAPLEMALHDGRHPLMRWDLGPKTGQVSAGAFDTFERFFAAFTAQLSFVVDQSVSYNNLLAEAHATLRPTPLLSSLIDGCVESGHDATVGGARYNSSGVACIGLADVTDSLLAIKKLVFDDRAVGFAELHAAVGSDFATRPELQAMIRSRVPLFGSGSEEAVAMARRVSAVVHHLYAAHRNFRGGPYTTGFWSMANHVAFGTLTGALPSGRNAGKPFTPGLTPQPFASKNLLDNLRDVAALDPSSMDNNMAFNVKVVPSSADTHAQAVDAMRAYAAGYFSLGGMQMQMNVVSSATLREAMAHPEQYRNLLVRISGYNAYFTTLNRQMQLELIERAEFGTQ